MFVPGFFAHELFRGGSVYVVSVAAGVLLFCTVVTSVLVFSRTSAHNRQHKNAQWMSRGASSNMRRKSFNLKF